MQSVTIIGGGVSGLAAACALADKGYRVRLLERRPYVGGRASSYEHPGTGEVIDNCQHILLGCCTNLIDLYQRLGVSDQIFWADAMTFIEPGGRQSVLAPSSLPAPLHTAGSFLQAKCFSISDKVTIARGVQAFLFSTPPDSDENFAQWLKRHHQTPRVIRRFWHTVLASALNEDPECISVHYAAKVLREVLLFSAQGGAMGIPRLPLSDLYGRAIDYIKARGGEAYLRTSVESFQQQDGQWTVHDSEGNSFTSDAVILALSFEGLSALLPALPVNPTSTDLGANLKNFGHSPITSIHLWFDREFTGLTHAALLDATIHWMYNKSKLQPAHRNGEGSYVELVVSASKSLVSMQRQQIIDLAMQELASFFPAVREAKLLKAAVTKEVRATYSIRPLLDRIRPGSTSPWPGIYLAGDWTATGWPSTMESGVRSGYLAAEAVARSFGDEENYLIPDLPPTGLMRLIS
jgi:squalene-associated FAD-dependent desaturase